MGNRGMRIKFDGGGLLIEVGLSRFEDFIMPHQKLKRIFLVILCRESSFFENIVFTTFSRSDIIQSIHFLSLFIYNAALYP